MSTRKAELLQKLEGEVQRHLQLREETYVSDTSVQRNLDRETDKLWQKLISLDEGDDSITERARSLCLRGQLLDTSPDYSREAEVSLIKAVKLKPSSVEAWNSLGTCFWKKSDLFGAMHCFNSALKWARNKQSLQQLSMLKRSMAKGSSDGKELVEESALTWQEGAGSSDGKELVEESVQHAKDAVMLDVKDCRSWYVLGNAHMGLYFADGAARPQHLRAALKAYQNTEKAEAKSDIPDLHFNRAMVYKYLEEHQNALAGFTAAGKLDPSLPWQQEVEAIMALVSLTAELVASKGHLKPKKLAAVMNAMSTSVPSTHTLASTAQLTAGNNKGLAVSCRVMEDVAANNCIPLRYVAVDHTGACFALSVLGLSGAAIKHNSTLTLLDPRFFQAHCWWEQKELKYPCIRMETPMTHMLCGGRAPYGFKSTPTLMTTNI
ncbi:hypothetical protein CYMTET_5481 [Cymbomonas tetramitiformis]|uniref:Tetratricopeptide repeat protein 5 OB fold domain-containing protein n=1 Tax=Cymbomonas tetramitiformis TaxID=36881 RepID=A0AAE0GZ23_9CHLO|nr:hypothetical protein CYMTET_5481 [Cymbomonas tetramitiformis]